ncbi:MAG: hypothetical protein FD174_4077 [Geobacteraceae bacterium]|nr:MAG: hypothetical protein FD174_4077 [Geobacteraceae bacterium]
MKIRRLPGILAGIVFLSGCAAKLHEDIPLVWKPTNEVYDLNTATLTGLYEQKIKVVPFVDARENRREIARNIEDKSPRPVTTKDDVGAWCTDRFASIMRQFGFKVVDSGETVVLKGEILQFYVVEDSVYKANVGIKVTAETPAGAKLWQGMMSGSSRRFGRSYKPENYYETLSDAYLEAVHGLLKSEEFRKAVQKAG